MPRLFVYSIEASEKGEPEKSILLKQLLVMASRLWYGITWPSAIITLGIGTSMLINQPDWLLLEFMQIKIALVILLYGYHLSLQVLMTQLKKGILRYSSQKMRAWNEVATLFLISIVFLIVLKNALSMVWGLIGLIVVTALILIGIKLYKKTRND